MINTSITLDDKYLMEEGTVYLTGVQALVRLPIDQARRDRRAGLHTGTFITGYEGSPMGGYDLQLARIKKLLKEYDIVHMPGVNEEIAITSIYGSQMTHMFSGSKFDGVTGIWYGKGPGIDRSGDALKHANFNGTGPNSAAIVLGGDDPMGKSSTLPFQSDYAYFAAGLPIMYPSNVQEFLEYGFHAIALSRLSGAWIALKVVTNLCDGGQTVQVSPDSPAIVMPDMEVYGKPFRKPGGMVFDPVVLLQAERTVYQDRYVLARAYARANGLNPITVRAPEDRFGIIAPGKSYADTVQALADMGLDERNLHRLGVRILKIGMNFPLDHEVVREFADGLDKILVIEEKRDFLESQVRDALYGRANAPQIIGKFDEEEVPLLPIAGELDPDIIVETLAPRLLSLGEAPGVSRRLEEIQAIHKRRYEIMLPMRAPNFCPGCPHNTSTVLPDGSMAGTGIGCHGMVALMDADNRRSAPYFAQMGAEGAPWIGTSPFIEMEHIFQNVGDGTYFHSGSQALRACVAAGVNITYKILYNGHVSMTGGQDVAGIMPVPELTRSLQAEGVKAIRVVAEDPKHYKGARWASNTKIYPRSKLIQAQEELMAIPGVTALVFDQECAAEKRRKRKRGLLEDPNVFTVINEDVCEGCGNCGEISNCMSLYPIDTEFGEKPQVHLASCNKDYTCIQGDCPSFLAIRVKEGTGLKAKTPPPELAADVVQEPLNTPSIKDGYTMYLMGIGGTGVVTVNALMCYAALMEGKHVLSLDQTGVAQKGGSVLSTMVIRDQPFEGSNKGGLGQVDLYLGLDVLGAASPKSLDHADPQRTVAILNSDLTPTGETVRDRSKRSPGASTIENSINRFTNKDRNIYVDASHIVESLFADPMLTNNFMVGVAYQAGLVPISAEAIEAAIQLNGVAVRANHQAFRYGRLYQHDPRSVEVITTPPPLDARGERDAAVVRLESHSKKSASAYLTLLNRCAHLEEESLRMLAIRIAELVEYQNPKYAEPYVDEVLEVARREEAITRGQTELTRAVIKYLYKLMAYKDEYEVARLHLRRAKESFDNFEAPQALYYYLHPPLLKSLGVKSKIRLGSWFNIAFRMLVAARGLRGSKLDLFGYASTRRTERELITWYRDTIREVLENVRPDTHSLAVEIAQAPDAIRGYESIKMRNVGPTRQQVVDLLEQLRQSPTPAVVGDAD